MKKTLLVVLTAIAGVVAGMALWSSFLPAQTASAGSEISERAARELQAKIDAVQAAAETPDRKTTERVEVVESELESFILFSLKEHIPARMDTFDVQLGEGTVAADTQLTFTSNGTGNPLVDALMGGTHNLFVRGRFGAADRIGRFQLEEVRVDGIPVPNILIETLIAKYVKPKYPEVDLNAPFEMPWGVDNVTITPGKASIVY
jgi:hypothetical protein